MGISTVGKACYCKYKKWALQSRLHTLLEVPFLLNLFCSNIILVSVPECSMLEKSRLFVWHFGIRCHLNYNGTEWYRYISSIAGKVIFQIFGNILWWHFSHGTFFLWDYYCVLKMIHHDFGDLPVPPHHCFGLPLTRNQSLLRPLRFSLTHTVKSVELYYIWLCELSTKRGIKILRTSIFLIWGMNDELFFWWLVELSKRCNCGYASHYSGDSYN